MNQLFRTARSPKVILGFAVFSTVFFVVYLVNFSPLFDLDHQHLYADKVIDLLRKDNIVRTRHVRHAEGHGVSGTASSSSSSSIAASAGVGSAGGASKNNVEGDAGNEPELDKFSSDPAGISTLNLEPQMKMKLKLKERPDTSILYDRSIQQENAQTIGNAKAAAVAAAAAVAEELELDNMKHNQKLSVGGTHNRGSGEEAIVSAPRSRTDTRSDTLPGAADHPILRLSDEQLRVLPLDEMMGWYGEADGGGSCAGDFGNQLIKRWRDTKESYCVQANYSMSSMTSVSAVSAAAAAGSLRGGGGKSPTTPVLGSSIDCYLVHQTRHHGNGDNLCHMRNVALDLKVFGDDAQVRPVVQKYVRTKHMAQPYVPFRPGFLQGDCTPDQAKWQKKFMPGWNADLTVGAFTPVAIPPQQQSESVTTTAVPVSDAVCAEWIEHPVLLTQRDTFANFFHDSEDFFNVFVALAVLQWVPGRTQILLTDLYPKGPFWDIWSRVYSLGPPTLDAWDLRQIYGNPALNSSHFIPPDSKKKVCFRDVAVGIYGPAAPMTVASWDTPCSRTALIRAYSDYIIRGLNLHKESHYAREFPDDSIVVTYMARRASKEWPERKYCDSDNSFFLCHLWNGFGSRKLGRMIRNDGDVVKALQGLENMNFPITNNATRIVFQNVDYNILTFEQQILTDMRTDVMIGPHGAGLMHNIFMRDRAMLIELFVDGSSVNRHFHNLAHWYGRSYRGMNSNNPISIPALVRTVQDAINSIDINKY